MDRNREKDAVEPVQEPGGGATRKRKIPLFWRLIVPHVLSSYITFVVIALLMNRPHMWRMGLHDLDVLQIACAPVLIFLDLLMALFFLGSYCVLGDMAFWEGGAWPPLVALCYVVLLLFFRVLIGQVRSRRDR